jgi:hypothetical protein
LSLGGQDDDLGSGRCHSDFDTTVAIFGQLFGEKVVELGFEDTSTNKLYSNEREKKKGKTVYLLI